MGKLLEKTVPVQYEYVYNLKAKRTVILVVRDSRNILLTALCAHCARRNIDSFSFKNQVSTSRHFLFRVKELIHN